MEVSPFEVPEGIKLQPAKEHNTAHAGQPILAGFVQFDLAGETDLYQLAIIV